MKKVIKIKESNILDIIEKIINEQATPAAQPSSVVVSGQLGTSPNFDGLKNLIKTLKLDVEKALRGATPYKIKTNNPGGVAKATIQGSNLKLTLILEPCKEEERDWYFDLALSIYSKVNSDAENVLTAKVMDKAAEKSRAFTGARGKIKVLGRNHIQMDQLPNLDPTDPQKTYNLYIMFISGGRPEGYQRAEVEPDTQTNPAQDTETEIKSTRSLKEGDTFYAIRSTDNQKYKLVIGKLMQNYNGFPSVYITGPGTYQSKNLDGTQGYDLVLSTEKPGELKGNTEMGSFKIISSGEEPKMISV